MIKEMQSWKDLLNKAENENFTLKQKVFELEQPKPKINDPLKQELEKLKSQLTFSV